MRLHQRSGRVNGRSASSRLYAGMAVAGVLWAILLAGLASCGTDVTESEGEAGGGAGELANMEVVTVKVTTCLGLGLWQYRWMVRDRWLAASEAERAHLAEVWSCVAEAPDCAAVLQCWYEREAVHCTDEGRWCDGSWLVNCAGPDTWAQFEDCSLNAAECRAEDDTVLCGVGSCTYGNTPDYCEGNAVHTCRFPGLYESRPCGQDSCFQDGSQAVCGDELTEGLCNSEPQQPVGYPWCDGDDILVCASLTVRRRSSCKDRDPDFTCIPDLSCDPYTGPCDTASCGMPPGSEQCSPGFTACVGDELQICDSGKLQTYDCSALAGATCADMDCVL